MNKKVVLVTGASSGMGKDMALTLLKKGHIVYGAARRVDQMKELEDLGGYGLALDITDELQIESVVERIIDVHQRIDVLINNAGYAVYGAVETVDIKDARRQFDVNLFGLAELTKAVIPSMRMNGSGTIINISSMGGKVFTPLGAWYHATKHALEGWSDCLRIELQQFGINVVVIEPGAINTEFGDVMYDPMVERAAGTPYEKMSNQLSSTTKRMYDNGEGSSVDIISNLVVKAIESTKPKRRYVAGKFAKPMLFVRRWFGDAVYEKAIMAQLK